VYACVGVDVGVGVDVDVGVGVGVGVRMSRCLLACPEAMLSKFPSFG